MYIYTYIYNIYIYFKIFQRLSSYTSYLHGASLHREDRTQGTVVSCQLKPHPQKPAKNRALVWINHCSCQADWPLDMTILRWHSYCRSCLLVIPSMPNQPLPSLPASTAESHPDKQIWWNKGAQMPMSSSTIFGLMSLLNWNSPPFPGWRASFPSGYGFM